MKPLQPSMRENKRYLLVRGKNLKENIEKAILEFIGILGMSKTGFGFIKTGKDFTIISVNREMVDSIRASFAVFSERITVEKVSGTLKGLKLPIHSSKDRPSVVGLKRGQTKGLGKKWSYHLSSIKYLIVLSGSFLPIKYSSTDIITPDLNFLSS